MSFMDLDATSDKATRQKGLSPEGFANNGPATKAVEDTKASPNTPLKQGVNDNAGYDD